MRTLKCHSDLIMNAEKREKVIQTEVEELLEGRIADIQVTGNQIHDKDARRPATSKT